MVFVTRKNLSLSKGKLAAQVAHAAVTCAVETRKKHKKWFTKWMREGAKKVIVKADDVDDLLFLKKKAEDFNIESILVTDAGHTEIPAGTKTVLGIGPAPNNLIDQITGHLSLL